MESTDLLMAYRSAVLSFKYHTLVGVSHLLPHVNRPTAPSCQSCVCDALSCQFLSSSSYGYYFAVLLNVCNSLCNPLFLLKLYEALAFLMYRTFALAIFALTVMQRVIVKRCSFIFNLIKASGQETHYFIIFS